MSEQESREWVRQVVDAYLERLARDLKAFGYADGLLTGTPARAGGLVCGDAHPPAYLTRGEYVAPRKK